RVLDRNDALSGFRIPNHDGVQRTIRAGAIIRTGRGDPITAGIEGDTERGHVVNRQLKLELPGGRIPYPDVWPITTAADDQPTIRADRHGADSSVVGKGLQFLFLVPHERCRVPDSDGAIGTGRGKTQAVRTEGHTAALAAVPAQAEDFAARRRVPDAHDLV